MRGFVRRCARAHYSGSGGRQPVATGTAGPVCERRDAVNVHRNSAVWSPVLSSALVVLASADESQARPRGRNGESNMDSVDLDVIRRSAEWIEQGRRVLLVTVVRTWGSSPRPPGALLAIRDDGHVVGSVSGGCIEDDLVERTRREGMTATRPEAVTYGVSADEAR